MTEYRIDRSHVEHSCCYDAVVIRDIDGKQEKVCECREDDAQMICDALNAAAHKETT